MRTLSFEDVNKYSESPTFAKSFDLGTFFMEYIFGKV